MSDSVDGMERERESDEGFYSDFCSHGKRSKGRDHGGNVEMPSKEGGGKVCSAEDVDPYKSASLITKQRHSKGYFPREVWKGDWEAPPDKRAPVILLRLLRTQGI